MPYIRNSDMTCIAFLTREERKRKNEEQFLEADAVFFSKMHERHLSVFFISYSV